MSRRLLVAIGLVLALAAGLLWWRTSSEPEVGASPSEPKVAESPSGAEAAGAHFTHFRVGDRNAKRIFADGDLVWVGTSGGAIRYELASDTYRLFDLRDGLLARGVFYVGRLRGQIAIGTYGGGLALHDVVSDAFKIYNIPEGLGDAFVYDALEHSSGDIWIATWSGVNRVKGGALDDRAAWELHTVESTGGALPNDWVYGLTEGRDGEVWLATEGGLSRFKDGRFANWSHAAGLGAPYEQVADRLQFRNDPAQYSAHHSRQKTEMGLEAVDVAYNPNYVVALASDTDGAIWAGTWGGGLAHFDGQAFRNFTVADGLPANHVFALHRDPKNRLWIGTSDGLALRAGDGFKVFRAADGLFSNIVFSIATAADGTLWVGSYGGVARLVALE